MDWSFYYHGPREPVTDYHCVTCLAGKRGECPTHGKVWDATCAHCIAAQGGPCRAHWGIDAALNDHKVEPDSKAEWDAARAMVNGWLSALAPEKKHVLVKLRGDALANGPSEHREYHLELIAR